MSLIAENDTILNPFTLIFYFNPIYSKIFIKNVFKNADKLTVNEVLIIIKITCQNLAL
jgi:hypothetical protein